MRMDFLSCFVAAESGFYEPATNVVSVSSGVQQSLFHSIPPERVGLQGEYDHHGLSKRVELALRQHFRFEDLGDWCVGQRGAVVLLQSSLNRQQLPPDLLRRIAQVVLRVQGATSLEFNGELLETAPVLRSLSKQI